MKPKLLASLFFLFLFATTGLPVRAQLLKRLGNHLEEKINRRAEHKADAAMDTGMDKAEAAMGPVAKKQLPEEDKRASRDGGNANCGNYYYLTNNSVVEMTAYDRKGHPAVVITYHITAVQDIPGGIQSKVRSEAKDQKGKKLGGGEGVFRCKKGSLSADMYMAMPAAPMEQFNGMELKATQAYLLYPGDMQVGQSLPSGAFHMDIYRSGHMFAQADMGVEDRTVEGKEQVTTPAGTWTCYRIGYTVTMKVKMGVTLPMHYTVTEWFAPGFGIVKTIHYNKKGKMAGHAELTKLH